eukprot:gene47739-64743_t
MRLTEVGRQMGLVQDARWDAFSRKRDAVSRETERLKATWVNPRNLAAEESERVLGKAIEHEYNLADLLRRPNIAYATLMSLDHGKYANRDLLPVGVDADDDEAAVKHPAGTALPGHVAVAAHGKLHAGRADRHGLSVWSGPACGHRHAPVRYEPQSLHRHAAHGQAAAPRPRTRGTGRQ